MAAVAIKLSEAGVGDYWDDVDGYARNQLIENQLIDADELARVSALGEPPNLDYPYVSTENVIEKNRRCFCEPRRFGSDTHNPFGPVLYRQREPSPILRVA